MNSLISSITEIGQYAYASGRCSTIIRKLQNIPRETHQTFEEKIDKVETENNVSSKEYEDTRRYYRNRGSYQQRRRDDY